MAHDYKIPDMTPVTSNIQLGKCEGEQMSEREATALLTNSSEIAYCFEFHDNIRSANKGQNSC